MPLDDVLVRHVPRLLVKWQRADPGLGALPVMGTVLSADLSGFTGLSEAMAELGRRGAEEVVSIVNACFGRMISAIEHCGGDVLKFGGDALLVLFEDDGHARRAAAAALELQRIVAEPISAPTVGRIELGLTVGLESGTVHLLLLDASHRELVVVGPTVSRALRLESAAERGEVVLGDEVAAQGQLQGLAAGPVEGSWLLPSDVEIDVPAAGASEGVAVPDPQDVPDLSLLVDAGYRREVAKGQQYGEIREVTTAFVAFDGVDDWIDRRGPRLAARRLGELAQLVGAAVEEYGVHWLDTDASPDGGKIHLTAGAPASTVDDAGAMLRAVRSITDACPFPLRIGVTTGVVFVGDVGSSSRRTLAAMGDSVNLAARLSGRAEPGQVVVARATLDRSGVAFEVQELEPFSVKGKQEPIHAAILGHVRREAAPPDVAPLVPMIGRDAEQERLGEVGRAAAAGDPQLVQVVGMHGIGRTRLVSEWLPAVDADGVLVATDQHNAATPFHGLRQLVRRLLGGPADEDADALGRRLLDVVAQRAPDLLPWTPLLAIVAGANVPSTPQSDRLAASFRRLRLQKATTELVLALLDGPTILVVEDLRWLDPASRELLEDFVGALLDEELLVVLTDEHPTELGDLTDAGTHVVELGPLDDDEVRELLGHLLPDGVSSAEVEEIVRRSAGQPLFAIELAAGVRQDDAAARLPASVEGAVTVLMDRLPAAARSLMRDLSVFGTSAPADLVEAVLAQDHPAIATAWEELDHFVVRDGDHVAFREQVHQEVAYEGLSFARRIELHGRIADVLERRVADGRDEVAVLAVHCEQAEDHARTFRWSRVAADRARASEAPTEAIDQLQRAAGAAEHLEDLPKEHRAVVLEELADLAEVMGRYDLARTSYEQAQALYAGRSHAAARIEMKLGTVDLREGSLQAANERYHHAMGRLADLADDAALREARGKVCLAFATLRERQGKMAEAASWAERALADATAVADRPTMAWAHGMLELSLHQAGDPRVEEHRGRALELYLELGDRVGQGKALNNLGLIAYYEGDWDAATDLWRRSAEAREAAGDLAGLGMADNNLGEILSDQGHHDEAEQRFLAAIDVWRTVRFGIGIGVATSNLGRLAGRRGDHELARQLQVEARERFEAMGSRRWETEVRLRQAEVEVLAGRSGKALGLVDGVHDELEELDDDGSLLVQARRLTGCALALEGDHAGAVAELRAAVDVAEASDLPYEQALADALLARLGEGDGAFAATTFARLGVVRPAIPDITGPTS